MSEVNASRELVNGLLVKLGIENPEKLTNDRAEAKVEAKIKAKGMPEDLTAEEYQYVKYLGLTGGAIPPSKSAEINDETQCPPEAVDVPATKPIKAKVKVEKKTISPAKSAEIPVVEEKIPHVLKGVDGGEDRTESITPAMAKSRNSRRADNRKWEPLPADAVVDSTTAEPVPEKAKKPKEIAVSDVKIPHRLKGMEGKPDRVELISPAKAELRNGQRSDDRRWIPDAEIDPATVGTEGLWIDQPKSEKKAKAEKPAKTPKPEKVVKVKAEKPVKEKTSKREGPSAVDALNNFFAKRKTATRPELTELLVKAGISEASATWYIAKTKQPIATKTNGSRNLFNVQLAEEKDSTGVKTLKVIKTA